MSIFFCQGCQQNKDSDEIEVYEGEDGQYCADCIPVESTNNTIEKVAKHCDSNSLEIRDIDLRVKKLEDKK